MNFDNIKAGKVTFATLILVIIFGLIYVVSRPFGGIELYTVGWGVLTTLIAAFVLAKLFTQTKVSIQKIPLPFLLLILFCLQSTPILFWLVDEPIIGNQIPLSYGFVLPHLILMTLLFVSRKQASHLTRQTQIVDAPVASKVKKTWAIIGAIALFGLCTITNIAGVLAYNFFPFTSLTREEWIHNYKSDKDGFKTILSKLEQQNVRLVQFTQDCNTDKSIQNCTAYYTDKGETDIWGKGKPMREDNEIVLFMKKHNIVRLGDGEILGNSGWGLCGFISANDAAVYNGVKVDGFVYGCAS